VSEEAQSLRESVARAARLLPAQGPITVFVHHNTLHALEDLPFDEALRQATAIFGCQPYLTEDRYRAELEAGRIRQEDLEAVLRDDLGARAEEPVAGLGRRFDLCLAMLQDPVRLASDAELHWLVRGSDALRKFRRRCPEARREHMIADTRRWVMRELRGERDQAHRGRELAQDLIARLGEGKIERWSAAAWEEVTLTLLWRVARLGVHGSPAAAAPSPPSFRLRDALRAATGEDSDLLVHGVLIRFSAAFTDQGLSVSELPDRDQGFYRSFLALYGRSGSGIASERWLRGLRAEIRRLERAGIGAEESLEESLRALAVAAGSRAAFVEQTLLALRGWAGMLWQLESRPDRVAHPAPPGTLLEFLAVRLILERLALAHVARGALGYRGDLAGLRGVLARLGRGAHDRGAARELTLTQRAFLVFLLAQSSGWSPRVLFALDKLGWESLSREIEGFSGIERRRIFHLAYERRYYAEALDGIAAHQERRAGTADWPELQVISCIDEREESFRRHLEEVLPGVETFGAAGFFGVAMCYQGMEDAREVPLCPVAIRPAHSVRERPAPGESRAHERGRALLRRLGRAAHRVRTGSRGALFGSLTALFGSIAALPLVARVLFPRLAARLRRRAGNAARLHARTELELERWEDEGGGLHAGSGREHVPPGGKAVQRGFTREEMAGIVEQLLRDIGLTRVFARLVVVVGHGSSSLNNPHEAAHDCGACGGARGGPNARAFAQMANDPDVRRLVARRGLKIPDETEFAGVYHNTCDDAIDYYDLERLPVSHADDLARARSVLDRARERNAHERCRRFRTVPLAVSPRDALRSVEARAEDLAQPRPEFGHATNALCVIGRRARTRGLFMDRRAFLVSYDPESDKGDAEHTVLSRILLAVTPVVIGISLEYYFSYVDPTGWGCGTKLPHNVTSLIGVMDGYASDLRPGLPWQMVEIHEPVRLLMVVEAAPAAVAAVLGRHAALERPFRNRWARLATLDPESAAIHVLEGGEFVRYQPGSSDLPEVESSATWYGGLREHLEFASIRPSRTPRAEPSGVAGAW
jgi:hypothetical protein